MRKSLALSAFALALAVFLAPAMARAMGSSGGGATCQDPKGKILKPGDGYKVPDCAMENDREWYLTLRCVESDRFDYSVKGGVKTPLKKCIIEYTGFRGATRSFNESRDLWLERVYEVNVHTGTVKIIDTRGFD